MKELRVGQQVIVRNHEGGSFVGHVTEVDDIKAIVTPDRPELRQWWPKGYDIGRAHWPAVEVLG